MAGKQTEPQIRNTLSAVILQREGVYRRNSSGDEIANVNFFTTTPYM